jgi:hypothetical protein
MKKILFLFAFISALSLQAQSVLPAENQWDWTPNTAEGVQGVGVPGGFLHLTAGQPFDRAVTGGVVDVTAAPYNADSTGATDATSAINAAIAATPAGWVTYLPPGTYRLNGTLSVDVTRDGRTLRGAGASTVIVASGATSQTLMLLGQSNSWHPNSPFTTAQLVSGTKTKGTTVLSVANASAFAVDGFAILYIENERDNTRITAGAVPTWASQNFPRVRNYAVRIAARDTTANTITIDSGLFVDCTAYEVHVEPGDIVGSDLRYFGVEDMRIISGNGATHWGDGLHFGRAIYCWVYGVTFERAGSSGNGNCIKLYHGFRNEVRKNKFVSKGTTFDHSDGAIQHQYQTNWLMEDNEFTKDGAHGWNVGVYSDGMTVGSVFAYNVFEYCNKNFLVNHTGGHMLMNLYEGNIGQQLQHDGYFTSSSHFTIFRNWFSGTNPDNTITGGWITGLNRFTRKVALIGNVWGKNGTATGTKPSYGNPNTGNGSWTGEVQPSAGTFWQDWNLTGTLTTRTNDTDCVITAAGQWDATSGGSSNRQIGLTWDGGTRTYTAWTSRSGNNLTLVGGSGSVLPVEGTVFTYISTGTAGHQERDLDVEASSYKRHNYESSQTTTGAVTDATGETPPASLFRTEKPDWFGDRNWPAISYDSPEFSWEATPSGYRMINGTDVPTGTPTVSTPTFSLAAGSHELPASFTISGATSGATYYWTNDGSDPDETDNLYTGAISLTEATVTYKVRGYKAEHDPSAIATRIFTGTVTPDPDPEPSGTNTTITGDLNATRIQLVVP